MAAKRAYARARLAVCILDLCLLCRVSGDSAILLSEPQDFDEVRVLLAAHTAHCGCQLYHGAKRYRLVAVPLRSCSANLVMYCFSQVFDSELCWLVLFTSLHALDVEDEAKRRFLLLPHYNKTFVTFASTTIEEQPDVATEFGVNMGNLPRVCA
tara:strand:+ start:84 stop:545 length:462 start_codon:yes stop_codon:yes gene_type:complete